ncbi:exo-1,4-beta-D-glucosaminidase [Sporothrix schenckii 1099-18]|uniref:Exo-1,4-beta-D-glucosaminidase n=1 Tax=Sporothrix schenckii 1099-18 TaxID=1397361 RepID=A0A0F2MEY2_SPOSC|nr:exo-1,4-beta-D-glucosaminidase [Sporothrix schenckii 1099-18]KJR88248.1 exo-1,4-beta-D-glucosaminidase [Sporothrix schenckii 1099-18]
MRLSVDATATLFALAATAAAAAQPKALSLVSAGDTAPIPAWDVQSSAKITQDPAALSKAGAAVSSSWHHAPVSRCTVFGCLLAAGVYNDSDLFFSDHLAAIDKAQFQVPWLYRSEFTIASGAPSESGSSSSSSNNSSSSSSTYYLLETNGITSRADIYLNGQQVADKVTQSGAYGGHVYDVTSAIQSGSGKENGSAHAIVVRAYPTNYLQDFGLGFVDWNPYPPDNGTGVWRDINLRKTGAVAIESFSVVTAGTNGTVTIRATVRNLGAASVNFAAEASIFRDGGSLAASGAALSSVSSPSTQQLGRGQTTRIVLTTTVDAPAIWWPRQWGDQPLYTAQLTVSTPATTSSRSSVVKSDAATKSFGFREVTARVSSADDILFSINGKPFQVLGGGYASDVFLRWDAARFEAHARYTLDMGLNTIRLEGKMEQPELYAIADRLGLMVLPGWECCDKWEAWSYNDDLPKPVAVWSDADYVTANASMRHEAAMQQSHPSLLGFLVGSDYWPDDRATAIYTTALADAGWQAPVVASAAKAGYPKTLGPGGMKMPGPYDWVPPNYWYDITDPATVDDDVRYGAAFGFGSEQGPGGGTPTLSSLKKFLSTADLDDLWRAPNKGLYHMSTAASSFHNRTIFNTALWQRYGAPTSLDDYLLKTQMADYEATRAAFEGFAANWGLAGAASTDANSSKRPATGLVYWMLNGAWPALHWALFDYYLHPAGAYYGVKAALGTGALEHVVYDYVRQAAVLVNRSQNQTGVRMVRAELINAADGAVISNITTATKERSTVAVPNSSRTVLPIQGVSTLRDVALLRLTLLDGIAPSAGVLSRSVYWLSAAGVDTLNWDDSNWYYTPVAKYAGFQSLDKLPAANVTATRETTAAAAATNGSHSAETAIRLENHSAVPAVFVSLNLVDAEGADVTPVTWSDNYVTLFPHETRTLTVQELASALGIAGAARGIAGAARGVAVQVTGKNVAKATVTL